MHQRIFFILRHLLNIPLKCQDTEFQGERSSFIEGDSQGCRIRNMFLITKGQVARDKWLKTIREDCFKFINEYGGNA